MFKNRKMRIGQTSRTTPTFKNKNILVGWVGWVIIVLTYVRFVFLFLRKFPIVSQNSALLSSYFEIS